MEELDKLGHVYCAKNYEKSTKQCSINLKRRLPLISNDKTSFGSCVKEWTYINGQPSSKNKKLINLLKKMRLDSHFFAEEEPWAPWSFLGLIL
jgi:hypothetical protein